MHFGGAYLVQNKLSFFGKVGYYLYGFPFLGSYVRGLYFQNALKKYIDKRDDIKFILDAGCGAGEYSFFLAERFPNAKIEAWDLEMDSILNKTARQLNIKNILFIEKDLFNLEKDKKFNLIICMDVLEHIEENGKILDKFYHNLVSGGMLFLHIPQKNWHEINFISKHLFLSHNEFIEKEHTGAIYDQMELEDELIKRDFKIIQSKKTFGYLAKFAWEFDQFLQQKEKSRIKAICLPFLKILAKIELIFCNKKGCGIFIVAQKS